MPSVVPRKRSASGVPTAANGFTPAVGGWTPGVGPPPVGFVEHAPGASAATAAIAPKRTPSSGRLSTFTRPLKQMGAAARPNEGSAGAAQPRSRQSEQQPAHVGEDQ